MRELQKHSTALCNLSLYSNYLLVIPTHCGCTKLANGMPIINPYYLNFVINTKYVKDQFVSRFKGVGVPNLHLNEIQATTIPPLSVQSELVEALETERQAVEGCKLLITKYEARIKAVIEKVF